MKEKADSGFRFFIKETSTQLSGRPLGYKGGGRVWTGPKQAEGGRRGRMGWQRTAADSRYNMVD